MDNFSAANALSALGHDARLHVFRLLVQAGKEGLSVGEIAHHVGLPASTLAHHLKSLTDAGLIAQEKRGRAVVSRVNYPLMEGLLSFLTEACCAGVDGDDGDDGAETAILKVVE